MVTDTMKCKAFLCENKAEKDRHGFCREHRESLAEYRKRKGIDKPLIDEVVVIAESIGSTFH